MDKITLNSEEAEILFNEIQNEFKNVSYISIFNKYENSFIFKYNNNYNNWGDEYYNKRYYIDCPLIKTALGMAHSKTESFIVWNDIIKTDSKSYLIEKERNKIGIYNGISIILNHHSNIIIISLCSKENVNSTEFTKEMIINKDDIILKMKKVLNII
jgi:hypothetical protein